MNVLVVLAHPEPLSFNDALFDATVNALSTVGHTVVTSDLYRMGFNPISDRRNFTSVKDAIVCLADKYVLHRTDRR